MPIDVQRRLRLDPRDQRAVEYAALLALAAYHPNEVLTARIADAIGPAGVVLTRYGSGYYQRFLLVELSHSLYFLFPGTEAWQQTLGTCLRFITVPAITGPGRVSDYVLSQVRRSIQLVLNAISAHDLAVPEEPRAPVTLIGHSLGGGIAEAMASEIGARPGFEDRQPLALTFGGPRCLDETEASRETSLHFRYFTAGDPVPSIPPTTFPRGGFLLPWVPLGTSTLAHSGTGVFIDRDGTMSIREDDPGMSLSRISLAFGGVATYTGFTGDHPVSTYVARSGRGFSPTVNGITMLSLGDPPVPATLDANHVYRFTVIAACDGNLIVNRMTHVLFSTSGLGQTTFQLLQALIGQWRLHALPHISDGYVVNLYKVEAIVGHAGSVLTVDDFVLGIPDPALDKGQFTNPAFPNFVGFNTQLRVNVRGRGKQGNMRISPIGRSLGSQRDTIDPAKLSLYQTDMTTMHAGQILGSPPDQATTTAVVFAAKAYIAAPTGTNPAIPPFANPIIAVRVRPTFAIQRTRRTRSPGV